MNIHIDKKIAGIIIASLLVGGAIGAAAGFAGGEEGRGEKSEMERHGEMGQMDDRADGETNDDMGGKPNQDEQTAIEKKEVSPLPVVNVSASTSVKVTN